MYFLDGCPIPGKIMQVVKNFYNVLLIAVPIILLVIGTVDLAKAVMAGDEKEIKGATSLLIKRAGAAIGVFLLGSIISFVLSLVPDSGGWTSCWNFSSGGNNSMTITCPAILDISIDDPNLTTRVFGYFTTSEKYVKYSATSGFRLEKDTNTTGKIYATSSLNEKIESLQITVESEKGQTAKCTIAVIAGRG